MTATNYLDLDINKLFKEHTIKEIEAIQKKIQYESDRKKIELRTLVGERYRDLILAADTIGKMKITSERVIQRIFNIEYKFGELKNKYLIGFKIDPIQNEDNSKNVEDLQDSIIIQIKILMDVPQHIWSSIENKDLLFATQLYLIALNINYSLLFEVGAADLSIKYPIIFKQWDVISQFKTIIFNECNTVLQSLDVQPESVANCLAAFVLLDGTSFPDLLEKLISMRNHTIKSIITDENDYNVKSKIKSCIEILIQTINLIYSCFINTENKSGGLVSQYLTKIQDQGAYSLLSQLDLNQELLMEFLPSVTKQHKPFLVEGSQNFAIPDLQKSIKSWLDWVSNFCNHEVTKLLDLIISIKGLYYVREESVSINLPENWNSIWEELSLPKITFWVEFFQPLISRRVKNIINDKWMETTTALKSDVVELLSKVIHDKFEYPEHDLRWFVWKDSPNDIPQKLTKNGGLDNKRSLLMKTKGYSPNIIKLCESFDKSLHALLADLEQYLYETERVMSLKDNLLSTNISLISDTFSDRAEIQEHLQTVSTSMIEDFINFVNTTCVNDEPEHGKRDINAVVMARFLLALTTLSLNLNKCFTLSKVSGLTITNTKWQSVCDKLKEKSTSVWSVWAKTYRTKIGEHKDKFISKEALDGYPIHLVISEWEKVTIEEDSGEGKRINSKILVPYQPSIQLQKFLTAVNRDLNKVIPHTLPKKVLHEIIEDTVTELLNHYITASNNANLSQKQAFQVLFDIKYSSLLMIPRESKTLSDLSTRACDIVLSKIDPFDYDVFNPFIHSNVKKSIQRSLLILGNLVPHLEQLHSILGARSEHSNTEGVKSDPPSVLALCTTAPWFPPLTVTAPARNLPLVSVTLQEKTQRKKVTTKETTKSDSAGATIKSGAAAFFGAMGSDWFSSS
ncbi:Conserved oligomeric Golgi complex subunit 1 [Habropoda laboriosa]|uniref:Conserved oligomeric Golgi complex subunit 1 n=1 Tax=Habropoda laboriosa TaxID=597456 RepID=A0A0L7QU42_9HYME|nr:Conserved oligomeric Golgi complex subunit 1 [Habropoda laboriosa]